MCHTVDPFVHSALFANVHCNELSVQFKASGFWYTINTGLSLKFFLYIPLLPQVMEILRLWFHRTSPLRALQRVIDGVVVGMGHLKALDMGGS